MLEAMQITGAGGRIQRRLVDALYTESMLLADEARHYYDGPARDDREPLDPLIRVGFSCESLKVTTRLMHVIAWLLTQRAVEAGELSPGEALDPSRRLADAPSFDANLIGALPPRARALVAASADLHRRVGRLDAAQETVPVDSPVHSLHARLTTSF